jgi:NAD(P)-dependent dehydrogenase (short-subunit alcohol dehydrogenase family)
LLLISYVFSKEIAFRLHINCHTPQSQYYWPQASGEGSMTSAKSIFITGGASGIGKAVAQHFAAQGWFVGLADMNAAGMAETAAMLPAGMTSCHVLDVRNRSDWDAALADFCGRTDGRLNVLFNNAGVARGGQFADVSTVDHDLLIDVNFKGVVYGAEAALPWLRNTQGSCLLNTASAAALYGAPGLATYAATKFAVRGLTESLDLEWEPMGIRVRSLMPGFINTPLLDVTTSGTNRTAREGVEDAGLEFTPVEVVAQAAWDAVHGMKLHHPIGKTAKQAAFFARYFPGLMRKRFRQAGKTVV